MFIHSLTIKVYYHTKDGISLLDCASLLQMVQNVADCGTLANDIHDRGTTCIQQNNQSLVSSIAYFIDFSGKGLESMKVVLKLFTT